MAITYKPYTNKFVRNSSSPKAIVCVGVALIISTFIILLNLPNQVVVEIENAVLKKLDIQALNNISDQDTRYFHHPDKSLLVKHFKRDQDVSYLNAYNSNETEAIRKIIKEMMQHAWTGYRTYAWGFNELKPLTKTFHAAGIFGNGRHMGATIVDSLDTLFIMGLKEEYESGSRWVLENIINKANFLTTGEISVFEINIRMVGGLLSMHSLTGEKVYLDAAHKIAKKLLPAFNLETGLPYSLLNLKDNKVRNYGWAFKQGSILAEVGTLSLEFQYLSDHTGDRTFENLIKKIYKTIYAATTKDSLPGNFINTTSGAWLGESKSLGALGDSYYEYLLKFGLYQGNEGFTETEAFLNLMSVLRKELVKVSQEGFTYVGEISNGNFFKKMGHLTCFSGGLFALAAMQLKMKPQERDEFSRLGKEITRTCHESYARTPTKLGPEYFSFDVERIYSPDATTSSASEKYYILRPEVVESYFYMWRMTKDPKYREWAWEAVKALEFHCRTAAGYVGLSNVYDVGAAKDDVQQSYFMAETLKYLYLTFTDDDVVSLDKYVFNTEAHPLLVRSRYSYAQVAARLAAVIV